MLSAPPAMCVFCGHSNDAAFERCARCEQPAADAVWTEVGASSLPARAATTLVLLAYAGGTALSVRYLWGLLRSAPPARAVVLGVLIAFMVASLGAAVSMARDALLAASWTFASRDGRAQGVASTLMGRLSFARGATTEFSPLDLRDAPGARAMSSAAALALPAHDLAAAMPVPDEPAGEASEVSAAERAARQGAVVCALAGMAARGEVELLGAVVSDWARGRDRAVHVAPGPRLVDVRVRAVDTVAAGAGAADVPRLERALREGLPGVVPVRVADERGEAGAGAADTRPSVRAGEAVAGALGMLGGVARWAMEAREAEGAACAPGAGAACAQALRMLFEARPDVARALWRAARVGISLADGASG